MVDPKSKILIIGGGIGGLTAALSLAKHGYQVDLFEQTAAFGEVGAGLTVAPNAMCVLAALGLADTVAEYALIPRHGGIGHYCSGEILVRNARGDIPETKYGSPYCQIHRADLMSILVSAVEKDTNISLHLDCTLTDVYQDEKSATAVFQNGRTATGEVIIGCDGVRSEARKQLFGSGQPTYTGYMAYRAVIPAERLDIDEIHPDSLITIGPGQSIARYLVNQGKSLNVAAFTETDRWADEGWSIPATLDEVLSEFSEFNSSIQNILQQIPEDKLFKWGLFAHPPLESWSVGRIALLGDAAHPMLPFLGQGAAMAIEDAYVLARAFAVSTDIAGALSVYQATRMERAYSVADGSLETVLQFHSNDPDNYDRKRHQDAEARGLFSYDATTVELCHDRDVSEKLKAAKG